MQLPCLDREYFSNSLGKKITILGYCFTAPTIKISLSIFISGSYSTLDY